MSTVQNFRLCRIAAIALLLIAIPCFGQDTCPWLNTATASGLLGGPAALSMTEAKTKDHAQVCLFRDQGLSGEADLEITVAAIQDAQSANQNVASPGEGCQQAVPLTGIGNSAVLCTDNSEKPSRAEVIGRVRDERFTVMVTMSKKGPTDDLAQKAEMAAEQVAGALF